MNSTDSIFAKALAETDAKTQAEFLNEFYRYLRIICKGKEHNQLCYIGDALDTNGRELCKELSSYADLAVESRAKAEHEISELWKEKRELETTIEELSKQKEEALKPSLDR